MRIENWSVVNPILDPYQAPETRSPSLYGKVFGHPKFVDGHWATTSSIYGKTAKNEVATVSGSSYELGQVDPSYEKKFPDAKNRLLNSL